MCLSCTPQYDDDGNEIDPLVYAMTLGAGEDTAGDRDFDELAANAAELFAFLKAEYGPVDLPAGSSGV